MSTEDAIYYIGQNAVKNKKLLGKSLAIALTEKITADTIWKVIPMKTIGALIK